MPTKTVRRGVLRWRAVVKVRGKTVASRWFGQGEREKRKAIIWEEEEKKRILEESKRLTPTGSLTMGDWATSYLDDVKERKLKQNYLIQRAAFRRLSALVGGDCALSQLTPAFALKFLRRRFVSCSGYAANRDRGILSRAWEWGRKFIDGFPNVANPFLAVERFPADSKLRYVPPEADFDKVMAIAEGQDKVMLSAFLRLAARRGELFGLKWSDVDFGERIVRLATRKTSNGSLRVDSIPMTEELRLTLLQWRQEQSVQSEFVFSMVDNAFAASRSPGDRFTNRSHFMQKICTRAGVTPFGFHSIRHLSAVILYKAGKKLATIQKFLRHQDATTTNRYLKSLGFEIEDIRSSVEVLDRGPAKDPFAPKE